MATDAMSGLSLRPASCGTRRLSLRAFRIQAKISGLQLRVQPVRPLAAAVERPEQPAFDHVEGRGVEICGPDGRVDAVVVLRAADVDADVASVDLDVLVAADVFDANVARGQADDEIGLRRHMDREPQ